jgi:hypothetical protein
VERGDWAAANAQFRAFIESLFDDIARHLSCPTTMATSGQRRTWLAQTNPPFFITSLNDWDFNGVGFMESFFRRLHPQGAHPGLSDEDDSTFRLHLVLLVSQAVTASSLTSVTATLLPGALQVGASSGWEEYLRNIRDWLELGLESWAFSIARKRRTKTL